MTLSALGNFHTEKVIEKFVSSLTSSFTSFEDLPKMTVIRIDLSFMLKVAVSFMNTTEIGLSLNFGSQDAVDTP